ncbi:hypothetical protein M378DRAFT_171448 [Amanita muscaria Koide BX008]|uniref:Uncharacterized protein n=1 Tax=Amanita muscaria (strain Koide BX008) TaxID=946122 RepID=A0A0C2WM06_AMAMK|nr:hypothetical protein M378DRAFT_171448 [Amanita muscaria Koide BX008]
MIHYHQEQWIPSYLLPFRADTDNLLTFWRLWISKFPKEGGTPLLQVVGGFEGEVWTRRHIIDLGVRLTTLIHVAVKLTSPVGFSLHPTFVFV